MNEIAAIVTFAYFTESFNTTTDEFKIAGSSDACSDFYKFLNDENHAEADIFTVFNKIMSVGQMDMFKSGSEDPLKKKMILDGSSTAGGIIETSKLIFDNYLNTIDKELYRHMKGLSVEPHIFLLRWIRCMTTREFHLLDAIKIWDSVFLEYSESQISQKTNSFRFLHYICLSMIIFVRQNLLDKSDQAMCLQRLLKYPPVENVGSVINLGWKYKADIETLQDENKKNEEKVPEKKTQTTMISPLAGTKSTDYVVKELPNNNGRAFNAPLTDPKQAPKHNFVNRPESKGSSDDKKNEELFRERLINAKQMIEKFLSKIENSQNDSFSKTEIIEALCEIKEAKTMLQDSITALPSFIECVKQDENIFKKEKSSDPLSKKVLF